MEGDGDGDGDGVDEPDNVRRQILCKGELRGQSVTWCVNVNVKVSGNVSAAGAGSSALGAWRSRWSGAGRGRSGALAPSQGSAVIRAAHWPIERRRQGAAEASESHALLLSCITKRAFTYKSYILCCSGGTCISLCKHENLVVSLIRILCNLTLLYSASLHEA